MRKKLLSILIFLIISEVRDIQGACAPPEKPAPCFSQQEFDETFLQAEASYNATELVLISSYSIHGFLLEEDEATYEHFKTHKVDEFVVQQNRYTTIMIDTLQILKARKNYTKQQLRWCIKDLVLPSKLPRLAINCSPNTTNYYRFDGQCNSRTNPHFGSVMTPFLRILEDGYVDGLEELSPTRVLETPRADSNVANAARGLNQNLSPETTSDMATMAFQILTHDMMATKKTQLQSEASGGGFDCCNSQKNPVVGHLVGMNKYCIPIKVPSVDPCFNDTLKCLNYIRAFRAFDQWNLNKAPAQVNFHTPVIDLDLIYNEISMKHLRENNGTFALDDFEKMKEILVGYDVRSMQLPGLFLYLHYFVQLHNEIVKEFLRVRPKFSFEEAAFETRKIVTGIFQKITVDLIMSVMQFQVPSPKCYDPSINPQVSLEFNHAFRVLHYFIRDKLGIYDRNFFKRISGLRGKIPALIDQGIMIDNLTFYENNKCGLLHGLSDTSWNLGGLGETTHCNFFLKDGKKHGTDLRSMDFQFGREMGEPSYVSFLRFAGLLDKCDGDVTINDMKSRFDEGTLNFLNKRYQNNLSEMGLSIALDMEARNGAILEPGVEVIIREQMNRTICGDRFWFNHEGGLFSKTQRDRIALFDMNMVLCVNHHCNDTRIQFFPFLSAGMSNKKVFCFPTRDILRILDLRTW